MIGNLTKNDRVNWLHQREVFLVFPCFHVLHWREVHISLDTILVPAFVYQTKREAAHRSNVRCKGFNVEDFRRNSAIKKKNSIWRKWSVSSMMAIACASEFFFSRCENQTGKVQTFGINQVDL